MRLPDFFIAGEMKCGSTTLWEVVSSDDRVYATHEKELHFFASYTAFGGSGPGEIGDLAAYASCFATARDDQICGEATPNYVFDLYAAERIETHAPGARFLVIVRDPVQRAWSHYWHQVRRGWETLTFERALEAEEERTSSGDLDARDVFSYVSRGRYAEHLERFTGVVGRERVLVLTLESLRARPAETLERVSAHLGLEPAITCPERAPHRNQADFPRFPLLDRAIQSARPVMRAAGPGVERLAERAARATRPLRRRRDSGMMRAATRARLESFFEESDAALERWLGAPAPWRVESAQSAQMDRTP